MRSGRRVEWGDSRPTDASHHDAAQHLDELRFDAGGAAEACLRDSARFLAFFARLTLREGSCDGVTVRVRVEGVGASETDPGHALVVAMTTVTTPR